MAIECPKCQTNNPEDSKFCKECAAPLPGSKEIIQTKTLETPTEELTRGTLFAGRYEIIEELGKGGMGKVYRVLDKKLNEEIALKLIKPEIASDKKTVERFQNELKIARKIAHKYVGRMFDLNEEKETYYITMEYVPGQDLKGLIRQSAPLSIARTFFFAKQICAGLTEAHNLGIIHRDLKPSNIMVDKQGNTRIMDFGIARSLSGKGITAKGVMIGTPEYMSPEQVEGKEVDQRSDLYSLGIIMYEMVTGRVPFEGDTPFVIGVKHKSEAPKEPKEFNPQIPHDLNQVILRCLEKEKEKRYQDIGEVLSALNQIEQGLSTTEPTVLKRKPITSKEITVRLTPKRLLIPAVFILALLVIAFLLFRKPGQKLDPNRVVVAIFENQTGDEELNNLGKVAADSITRGIVQTNLIDVVHFQSSLQSGLYSDLKTEEKTSSSRIQIIARITGAGIIVSGTYYQMGENLSFQAEITSAEQGKVLYAISPVSGSLLAKMETIRILRERIVGALVSHLNIRYGQIADWRPPLYEAYNEFLLGIEQFGLSYTKSFQHLERAIEIDPTFQLPRIWLANGYFNLGSNVMTEELITEINQHREELSQFERLTVDRLSANLQGKSAEAYQYSLQSLQLAPTNVITRFIHASLAVWANRPREAVEVFENTQIELLDKFLLTAWNRAWFRRLGHAYHMLGKYKKELKAVQQCREYMPNSLFSTEAGAYAALGKIDQVKSVINNSQTHSSRLEDPGTVMLTAAAELREHGHLEESKELANQAVRWFERVLLEKGETESQSYNLARALYLAERWDEALAKFEHLHKEFPDNIAYLGYRGTIAARKGEEVKAQEVSEQLKNMDIPYLRGAHTIWRARIASLLHKQEEAFKLLRESLMQGRNYGVALLRDIDFEPIRDYKPFQELLKPKE